MSESEDNRSEAVFPHLDYRLTTGSGPRQEGRDYLIDFDVKILGNCWPEDGEDDPHVIHLGNLRATLIRLGRAGEEGFSLSELFDYRQEIESFGSELFEAGYESFVKPVRERFPYAFAHDDLLYIHWLTVKSIARGQRVGVSALHRFMTDWESGCSLIAIDSTPAQFAHGTQAEGDWESLGLEGSPGSRAEATAKLENHYRGLGFHKVGTLPFMLLCPAKRQAPLPELALEDTLTLSREELDSLAG